MNIETFDMQFDKGMDITTSLDLTQAKRSFSGTLYFDDDSDDRIEVKRFRKGSDSIEKSARRRG